MSFNENLPSGNAAYGELRVDPADLLTYRYVVGGWILEGSATPSSDSFPDGSKAGEIREDIFSGGKFQWSPDGEWVPLKKLGEDANQNEIVDESDDSAAIAGVTVTNTPSVDQALIATSETEAEWQDIPAADVPLTTTVTLTSAQIKALNTTPITLVAAPGAGLTIIPTKITFKLNYNTVPYTPANLAAVYENETAINLISIPNLLNKADYWSMEAQPSAAIGRPNAALKITTIGMNPTAGDSTLRVTVEYHVIAISTESPPTLAGIGFSGTVPDTALQPYTNLKMGAYRTGKGTTAAPLFWKATGVTVTAASGDIMAVSVGLDGYVKFNYSTLVTGFDPITVAGTDEYGRAFSLVLNNEIIY